MGGYQRYSPQLWQLQLPARLDSSVPEFISDELLSAAFNLEMFSLILDPREKFICCD